MSRAAAAIPQPPQLEPTRPELLPDFDNATAYVVGRPVAAANRGGMIENVVSVYGCRGKELVARGYLSFEEARRLRDALTKAVGS